MYRRPKIFESPFRKLIQKQLLHVIVQKFLLIRINTWNEFPFHNFSLREANIGSLYLILIERSRGAYRAEIVLVFVNNSKNFANTSL